MTLEFLINQCSLMTNNGWGGYRNLQIRRKVLYAEIFSIFLIYFISQLLQAFKYKKTAINRNSDFFSKRRGGNRQHSCDAAMKLDRRPDLPWHEKRWNRHFSFIFSSHAIALGMVILFSPLTGAIIISYFHLFAFICFCFCQLKKLEKASKFFQILLGIFNLILMIIGTVGINYAQYQYARGHLICKKYVPYWW